MESYGLGSIALHFMRNEMEAQGGCLNSLSESYSLALDLHLTNELTFLITTLYNCLKGGGFREVNGAVTKSTTEEICME